MVTKNKSITCCIKFKDCDEIQWKKANGPLEDGWGIIDTFDSLDCYVTYINIQYCPFCGTKLTEQRDDD